MTAGCYCYLHCSCHINLERHYGNGNSTNYFRARRSQLGLKLGNFCLCSLGDIGLGKEIFGTTLRIVQCLILKELCGFVAKWRLWDERRNSLLMTRHYTDLGSACDWSCCSWNLLQPIRSTTQIWVVSRHQYGISALVSQTSFRGETSGGVAKCRLFSQVMLYSVILKVKTLIWIAELYLFDLWSARNTYIYRTIIENNREFKGNSKNVFTI